MIQIKLLSPIGKEVKLPNNLMGTVPFSFYIDEKDIDNIERSLKVQNVKYEIVKQTKIIKKEKIEIKDEIKVNEEIKINESKEEERKSKKRGRKRKIDGEE